jgi:hypothetical protein
MIVIETLIGATSIVAIWYIVYLVGILVERHVLQEDDIAAMPWIWPYVFYTLSGIFGLALLAFVAWCAMMAWYVGSGIMQSIAG